MRESEAPRAIDVTPDAEAIAANDAIVDVVEIEAPVTIVVVPDTNAPTGEVLVALEGSPAIDILVEGGASLVIETPADATPSAPIALLPSEAIDFPPVVEEPEDPAPPQGDALTKPPARPAAARPDSRDRPSLSIVMIASEALPFAKTGGLADVVTALPIALARLGHRVTTVVPRYRGVEVSGEPRFTFDVRLGQERHRVKIFEVEPHPGARVWLVDQPALFDRDGIYGRNGHDHPDNPRRYALLARAALDAIVASGDAPDIIHSHDWQGGLAPVYLKTRAAGDPILGGVPSIFTIHNVAYTGLAEPRWMPALDLAPELYRPDGGLEYWQHLSFLKAGINFSEKITTVSPGYARELLTPEFAFGFEGVLNARRRDLVGILNGIDADTWNPATDPLIPARYTADDLSGKVIDKRELLRAYGLPSDAAALRVPLIGMVSRMVDQKGLDLIAQAVSELPQLGARFVVLGTGEPRYEEMWRGLASYYPDRIGVTIGFDERLSHLVEAGSDLFLMPSRFEPCGLNQMYSLRYGTLPFVRATGGLDDTVDNYHPATGGGNGFKFWEPSGPALVNTLRWALSVYQQEPDVWRRLQRAGMAADFSWSRSAQQYVDLYVDVLRTAGRLPRAAAKA